MQRPVKLIRGIVLLLLLLVLFASEAARPVEAFNLGGTGGHKEITYAALGESSIQVNLEGSTVTFTRKALDRIVNANADVDYGTIFGLAINYPHFDDEELANGSMWVKTLRERVINALDTNDPSGYIAQVELGRALHTIQDFYAHSNWVELGPLAPSIDWGNTILTAPSPNEEVCSFIDSGKLVGAGLEKLTTGYYPSAERGKCSHSGIAKDSINHPRHNDASNAATRASKEFVEGILNDPKIRSKPRAIRALLGIGAPIIFVLDTTASMQKILPAIATESRRFVDTVSKSEYPPDEYILYAFADPIEESSELDTADANAFIEAIDHVLTTDGGDCPEPSLTALSNAIDLAPSGSNLYVFTDATAKDADLKERVNRKTAAKDIRLVYVLNGICSSGEFYMRITKAVTTASEQPESRDVPLESFTYAELAANTGGKVVAMGQENIRQVFDMLATDIVSETANLLYMRVTPTGSTDEPAHNVFDVPIDSTVSQVTFSVIGDAENLVQLKHPGGYYLLPGTQNVLGTESSLGMQFDVADPDPGNWQLDVLGSGEFFVSVNAVTPLTLQDIQFFDQTVSRHGEFLPIDGSPAPGTAANLLASIGGPAASVNFRLRSMTGADLGDLEMEADAIHLGPKTYHGTMQVPTEPFWVEAYGVDQEGHAYQRRSSRPIQPTPLGINLTIDPASSAFWPEPTTPFSVSVTNYGEIGTYIVVVRDNLQSDPIGYTSPFTLTTGEAVTFTSELALPPWGDDFFEYHLTAEARPFFFAPAPRSEADKLYQAHLEVFLPPIQQMMLPLVSPGYYETILFDDFSDPASGWPIADDESSRRGYVNGEYELYLRTFGLRSSILFGVAPTEKYFAQVELRLAEGGKASYGLVMVQDGQTGKLTYNFMIDPSTQEYAIFDASPGAKPIVDWTHSQWIHAGNGTNLLRLERESADSPIYRIFINHIFLTEFTSTGTTEYLGIRAEKALDHDLPSAIRIDNFRVAQELPPGR